MMWLASALASVDSGTPAMWVVLASARGSSPREAGASMLVDERSVAGTIGGGTLEHRAIALARSLLARGADAAHVRVPLGPSLGQCCGGLVSLVFKRLGADDRGWLLALQSALPSAAAITLSLAVTPPVPIEAVECGDAAPARIAITRSNATTSLTLRGPVLPVLLFGAGHVGRALVQALTPLPVAVAWVDPRDDAFPPHLPPNARTECTDTPVAEIAQAAPGAAFVIATHLHSLDEDLAEAVLRRGDFAYLGVIGSAPKRQRFARRFAARGLTAAHIDRMQMPMGIVSSKEPEVIAAGVAAELMQVRARQHGAPSLHLTTTELAWTSSGPTSSTG
jgi:xanthine dehydrogenase accessory factor